MPILQKKKSFRQYDLVVETVHASTLHRLGRALLASTFLAATLLAATLLAGTLLAGTLRFFHGTSLATPLAFGAALCKLGSLERRHVCRGAALQHDEARWTGSVRTMWVSYLGSTWTWTWT